MVEAKAPGNIESVTSKIFHPIILSIKVFVENAIVFQFLFHFLVAGLLSAQEDQHYIAHCTVFDRAGTVLRKLEGKRCVFFPDGRVAVGGRTYLRFYSADMRILWEKPIETHHQMNLNLAGDRLLVMTSSVHKQKRSKIRYDKLLVLNLKGREKAAFDFFTHRKAIEQSLRSHKINQADLWWIAPQLRYHQDVEWEFSHANSFYEIPENEAAKTDPRFKKGNYLVSINALGILMILDPSLKKILWLAPHVAAPDDPRAHDAQMLKTGRILVYSNVSALDSYSSIEEFDPLNGKTQTLYRGDPPKSFAPARGGGVQILKNGNYLISDNTLGGQAFEYDPKLKKKVWTFKNPETDQGNGLPGDIQQMKALDLSGFLRLNKGF